MEEITKTVDSQVLELFNKVKAKQKEISEVEKPRWETSCTIGFSPDSVNDRINIQTTTDLGKLLDVYSFVTEKKSNWEKASVELGVKAPTKYMAYEFDLWKKDIATRIKQINISTKKSDLKVLESRLNSLISPEQRREMELAELMKEVKDLD